MAYPGLDGPRRRHTLGCQRWQRASVADRPREDDGADPGGGGTSSSMAEPAQSILPGSHACGPLALPLG